MALLALAAHLVVNALGGYGYFRDELYYIACSKRPPESHSKLEAAGIIAAEQQK
jgi:hypothetical protein